jgi:hypothetical protein
LQQLKNGGGVVYEWGDMDETTSDVLVDIHPISLLLEAYMCFCTLRKLRLSICSSESLYELTPNGGLEAQPS